MRDIAVNSNCCQIKKRKLKIIENREMKNLPRYICFYCIDGSTNPDFCTNCGALIGKYNFESAVLIPPQSGHYHVAFKNIPESIFESALTKVKMNFYQRFDIEIGEEGADIQSMDIAYDRLIAVLSSMVGTNVDELKKIIAFEVMCDRK